MMIVALLAANVAVYALMAVRAGKLSFGAGTLFDWGGNLGLASLHGQYWRLLTATFEHASLPHLFGNMVLLLITGGFLQQKLGTLRFGATYLVSGLVASLLSAILHPDVVSVGASGAIAGLLGAMVSLKLARRAPEVSGAWMVQVIAINAIYSFAPNVDWAAHAGGLLAGLALGAALAARMPAPEAGLPEPEPRPVQDAFAAPERLPDGPREG